MEKTKQSKGGDARMTNLSPERRQEIAKQAATARWERKAEKTLTNNDNVAVAIVALCEAYSSDVNADDVSRIVMQLQSFIKRN